MAKTSWLRSDRWCIAGHVLRMPAAHRSLVNGRVAAIANSSPPRLAVNCFTGWSAESCDDPSAGYSRDFPGSPSGLAAVKAGRIDGYATVAMNVEMQLREMKDPGLERADPFEQPVESGKIRYGITSFAVRLDDKDLLDEINKHLLAFRGTPEYLAILEKYGLTEADLPPEGITTAKVCAG